MSNNIIMCDTCKMRYWYWEIDSNGSCIKCNGGQVQKIPKQDNPPAPYKKQIDLHYSSGIDESLDEFGEYLDSTATERHIKQLLEAFK